MLNKKIMVLAILFVSLLTVSAVSAANNGTDDVVSVEENAQDNDVLEVNVDDSSNVLSDDGNDYEEDDYYDDDDECEYDPDWDDEVDDSYSDKESVIFKKKMKVGKYTVKLSSKQYKTLIKAAKKGKYKKITVKTKYKYKVKIPYTKKVKKYKTLKTVKTFYGTYLSEFKKMRNHGWKLKSEKVFTKKNPKNKYGIGLSAYTYSISKWVKKVKKTKYKTKKYPVKAKIAIKTNSPSTIKVYSKGVVLYDYYLGVGQ